MGDARLLARRGEVLADPCAYPVPPGEGPSRTELLEQLGGELVAWRNQHAQHQQPPPPGPAVPTPTTRGEPQQMPAPTPHQSTRERRVATNGIELNAVEAGDGFPAVLAQGFPWPSFSCRNQVPALADAGCKVLCPDQRRYGKSD